MVQTTIDENFKKNKKKYKLCPPIRKLRLAVCTFKKTKDIKSGRFEIYGIEDLLIGALKEFNRFCIVERQSVKGVHNELKMIVQELKMSQSGLVDEDTILEVGYEKLILLLKRMKKHDGGIEYKDTKLRDILNELKISLSCLGDKDLYLMTGKILSADCMLFGSVRMDEDLVKIEYRIMNTETQDVLANGKKAAKIINRSEKKLLSRRLGQEIARQFPISIGYVKSVMNNNVEAVFDSSNPVKKGMKIVIFRLLEPDLNTSEERRVCNRIEINGHATIIDVRGKLAYAEPERNEIISDLTHSMYVITR